MMNDGGPAFPTLHLSTRTDQYVEGMTLRDYFAAMAMLAACHLDKDEVSRADIAEVAYKMADAMLKERAKHE